MKCPFCGNVQDKVIDSRMGQDGQSIRRRRECLACNRRYTTYEVVEEPTLVVIKRNNDREPFNKEKVKQGIVSACRKRPVPMQTIEQLIAQIEQEVQKKTQKEIPSSQIGEIILAKLRTLDQVAYVRFASVYKKFGSIQEFKEELEKLKQ